MAASHQTTPEEKLLHIIENSKEAVSLSSKKSGSAFGQGAQKAASKAPGINIGSIISRIGSGVSNFNPAGILSSLRDVDPKKITMATVNKGLIAVSVILTIMLTTYLIGQENFMQTRFRVLKGKRITTGSLPISLEQKDMPTAGKYVNDTTKNNPFHLLPVAEKVVQTQAEEVIDLKLVGILWSDQSQAIIEDTITGETHLVYEGDSVYRYTITEITSTEVKLKSEDGKESTLQ